MAPTVAERTITGKAGIPHTTVYTDLFHLIAAVQEAIEPGEEAYVTPTVLHMLHAGQARWLRDVDARALWDAPEPASLPAALSCTPVRSEEDV